MNLVLSILRPGAARFRRVLHPKYGDLIVQTIEFEYEGRPVEAEVAYDPEGFGGMIVASLRALDFPEGDVDYIEERISKDLI